MVLNEICVLPSAMVPPAVLPWKISLLARRALYRDSRVRGLSSWASSSMACSRAELSGTCWFLNGFLKRDMGYFAKTSDSVIKLCRVCTSCFSTGGAWNRLTFRPKSSPKALLPCVVSMVNS